MTQVAKLSSLKSNLQREADGDWVPTTFFPETEIRYQVRSLNYAPYRTARNLAEAKLNRKYGFGRIPPEEMTKMKGRLLAQHILLGWSGFDVEYTKDVALTTLADPEYRDVVNDIETSEQQLVNSEVEFTEAAEKN